MATAYTDQVQKVYIAYYGRAADPVGLAYWAAKVETDGLAGIMASFGASAEATSLYGSLTNTAKVNALYQQSFGRDADFAGLMYYAGQLTAGTMTAATIAQNIFDGAAGGDATILANKLIVAKAYTAAIDTASEVVAYSGTVAAASARALLSTVDAATVTASFDVATSVASIETAAAVPVAGKSYNLTTSADAMSGTVAADTFNGALVGASASGSTVQAGDNLTGAGGADTLKISATGAAGTHSLAGVQTTGIQTLDIQDFTNSGVVTYDVALMDGLTAVSLSASGVDGDVTVSNLTKVTDASMKNGTGDLTLTYTTAAVVGTADSQNLTLSNVSAGAFAAAGIETIAINSTLVNNVLASLTGAQLTTVNIAGDKNVTITTALANAVTTVDGSAATGKITVGIATGGDATVTGGSGADSITIAGLTKADTIDGGAGSDTLKITSGATQTFLDHKISNIEILELANPAGNSTNDVKAIDDTTSISLKAGATSDDDIVVSNLAAAQAVTVTNDSANTFELGDVALNLEDDTGLTDSMTVKLVAKTNVAQTLDLLTMDDASETLNLDVSGVTTTTVATTLTSLIADGAKTINITGAGNFVTTLNQTGTNVTTLIDASAHTGELKITDAVANDMTFKGSVGQNTLVLGTSLTNKDTITGGAHAKDSVAATVGTATTATTGKFNLSAFETLALTATDAQTATVDMSASSGVTTVSVIASSTTGNGVVNLKGLAAGTKVGLAEVATNDFDGTLNLTLADATGTSDALTLELGRTSAAVDNFTVTSTGIESLTISAVATASPAGINVSGVDASTLTLTGGDAGTLVTLTQGSTKLHKNVTTVDASGLVGALVVDASGTDSVGVAINAGNLLITTTSADSIIGSASTTSFDSLVGTFAATDTSAEFTQIAGIEDYTLTFKDAVAITTAANDHLGDNGDSAIKTVTMTGGNSLSKYIATATGAIDGANLTSFDASGLGGEMQVRVTAALMDTLTVKGSTASAKDAVIFDAVNGLVAASTGKATTEGVETITLTTATAASTIDTAGMVGVTTIAVENDQNVTLNNVAAGVVVQLGESTAAGLEDYTGTLKVVLADATGTDDALTVQTIGSGIDDDIDAALTIAGVETVTLKMAAITAAANADIDISGVAATKMIVTGGVSTEDLNLALTVGGAAATMNAATTTLDASAFKGILTASAQANTGVTMIANGGAVATLLGSSTADTFTIGKTAAVTHDISGGTGTDTVNMTLNTGTTAMTSMEGAEIYNLTVDSSAVGVVVTAAASKFFNDTMVETVNLIGGSTDSTFDSGTDGVDSASTLTLFDASSFKGRINDLLFDADQLASTVTVKGGSHAKDLVSATYANDALVRMSGVETLGLTFNGTKSVDVSNVTGMTAVTVASDTSARVGTVSQLGAGVTISLTTDDASDGLTVIRSDASATDNVQNLTLMANDAGEAVLFDMANVETLNVKMGTGSGQTDLNLSNFDMDTAGKTNAVVVTGAVNLDIDALSTDTISIDASAMTAGGVDISARNVTALTFTGSNAGADSVLQVSGDDVLTGGEKASVLDVLNVTKAAILGGILVDLTKDDQVVSFNGSSNAAIQTGFESVDVSNYSGFGAELIGNAEANTFTGTALADSIGGAAGIDILSGGAGADTITGGAGADTITGGTGADTIDVTAGTDIDVVVVAAGDANPTTGGSGNNGTLSGFDVVSGFAAGDGTNNSDHLNIPGTGALEGDGAVNGTDSLLTVGGIVLKSHKVISGVVTFDDADSWAAAIVMTSDAHAAAIVEYLQLNDIGSTGDSVIFDVGADNYLYTQGNAGGTNSLDSVIKLVGVQADALITTNAAGANDVFIS